MCKSQLIGHCKPNTCNSMKIYEYLCCPLTIIHIDSVHMVMSQADQSLTVSHVKSQNTKFVSIQCFSGTYWSTDFKHLIIISIHRKDCKSTWSYSMLINVEMVLNVFCKFTWFFF